MTQATRINFSVSGRQASNYYANLNKHFGTSDSAKANLTGVQDAKLAASLGFPTLDAQPASLTTTASITNPVQFLQTFLPGTVRVLQAPTTLEEAIGFTQAGTWEGAEIVQQIMEWAGFTREYGDWQAKPTTSWNRNFDKQNIVRFEVGVNVGRLEEARAAHSNISDANEKQGAATLILQQILNDVGYNGYNSGDNLTFGFLNNPNLPAYVPVADNAGATSKLWANKTWLERQKDVISWANGLLTNSKGRVNVKTQPSTLMIPLALDNFFSSTTDLGYSLKKWFDDNYPMARLMAVPNLDLAASGLNAVYWFADSVPDSGTDDGSTFRQVIPARMVSLGTEQQVGGYKTGYSCATAGTFALRPFAVYRASAM